MLAAPRLLAVARVVASLAAIATGACAAPRVSPPFVVDAPPARGPLALLPGPGPQPADVAARALEPGPAIDEQILAEGAAGSGEISFTFDDGPAEEPWLTPEVLRLLAEHRVRGTFFLTGQRLLGRDRLADARRAVAQRIVAEGHLIGNHALDHRDLSRERRGEAWIRREIEESAALIERTTGVHPSYFRPPYGKLGPTARDILSARGDTVALWTIDGHDVAETDPERLAKRLCGQLQFAGQGIVLLHDLRPASVQALAIVLQWLERHRRVAGAADGFAIVDLPTFLRHAAARPYHQSRMELYRERRARMEAWVAPAAPALGRPRPDDGRFPADTPVEAPMEVIAAFEPR